METLPTTRTTDIQALISQALESHTPVETLERLLAMVERREAKFAHEEFNRAFLEYQSKVKAIVKTHEVRNKQNIVMFKTAPFDTIIEQVRDLISQGGFLFYFVQELKEKSVRVTCIVEHISGHKKESPYESPFIENEKVQHAYSVAGTSTLARRYAFCNAFGIATADDDPDNYGTEKGEEKSTQEQIETIEALIVRAGMKRESLLRGLKREGFADLPFIEAQGLIVRLQQRIEQLNKVKEEK